MYYSQLQNHWRRSERTTQDDNGVELYQYRNKLSDQYSWRSASNRKSSSSFQNLCLIFIQISSSSCEKCSTLPSPHYFRCIAFSSSIQIPPRFRRSKPTASSRLQKPSTHAFPKLLEISKHRRSNHLIHTGQGFIKVAVIHFHQINCPQRVT